MPIRYQFRPNARVAWLFLIIWSITCDLVSANQAAIDPLQLGGSEYCGHCHTDIFQQWNASSHHFSSFNNPIYRKVAESVINQRGREDFAFCAGCHDPLLMSSQTVETFQTNSWEANAGITCLACHRITEIGESNGDYRIEAPILHPFALSEDAKLAKIHKAMIEMTPWLHRGVLSKPFYGSTEYCASCHSLRVPASINGHVELVLSDERGQLHDVQHNNNSTDKKVCIDCHMPEIASNDPAAKDGLIRSHRFAASNTALPLFNRDFDQLEAIEQFLTSGIIELRLAGVRKHAGDPYQAIETLSFTGGDQIDIAIHIYNRGVGHQFPTGTVDSNEAWLSITGIDGQQRQFLQRGQLDEQGLLPNDAIRFGASFVDALGNLTDRRNTTTEAISVRDSSVIAAGAIRTVYVTAVLPKDIATPVRLEVKLLWRKYSPQFIDWVFDGRATPSLPITTIAELQIDLPFNPTSTSLKTATLGNTSLNARDILR